MGLLSTYVAYRLGKRSERRTADREQERTYSHPMSQHCIHYDYCTAREQCPEFTECEYE